MLEELIKEIGAEVKVEELNRVGARESGKEMWLLRLGSEEQKREMMRKSLKERRNRWLSG